MSEGGWGWDEVSPLTIIIFAFVSRRNLVTSEAAPVTV